MISVYFLDFTEFNTIKGFGKIYRIFINYKGWQFSINRVIF